MDVKTTFLNGDLEKGFILVAFTFPHKQLWADPNASHASSINNLCLHIPCVNLCTTILFLTRHIFIVPSQPQQFQNATLSQEPLQCHHNKPYLIRTMSLGMSPLTTKLSDTPTVFAMSTPQQQVPHHPNIKNIQYLIKCFDLT